MIIKNPRFEISAVSKKQYPQNDLPEIVLVGKSNVGKSSFINTLTNRKSLARTSNTPGKTRQINFYNIDDSFYLVDLPGYGYSIMSKEEQVKVGKFIEDYLTNSKKIALIILVLDIRHKPTADDKMMYDFIINSGFPFICVTNKADKIAPTKVEAACKEVQNNINSLKDITFLPFSSERKIYTEAVWEEIEKYLQ